MSSDATDTTTPAEVETPKAAKPDVLDPKDNKLALNVRVKLVGDQDKDDEGKPKLGTITGIEYQRQRVVVKVDGQEKLVVRPAAKVNVKKTKSGKVEMDTERMAKAVRGAKAKTEPVAEVPAESVEDANAPVPVDETNVTEAEVETAAAE